MAKGLDLRVANFLVSASHQDTHECISQYHIGQATHTTLRANRQKSLAAPTQCPVCLRCAKDLMTLMYRHSVQQLEEYLGCLQGPGPTDLGFRTAAEAYGLPVSHLAPDFGILSAVIMQRI